MPQTLTEIKALLAARGIHPRHRFGQNFLIDANKLREVLAAASIQPGDVVLEVGPGTGTLTESMLEAGARVIAVEIDRDMTAILRGRIGPDSDRFALIEGDVMDGKHALNPAIAASLSSPPQPPTPNPQPLSSPFKLIANLPYNIASPLLAVLAADYPAMTSATVMIQREVADRILAAPGGKEYGPLTVILQALCHIALVTKLSPGCFWPPPTIDSAVIRLTRRAKPLTQHPAKLSALLQTLFSKRRKQIGTILGRATALPPGIDPSQRPEELTVEQLVALAETTG
jgi:16S rRNA (adenine1518-N6/adenine1519-N6)-dimethyltransferase